MGSRVRFLIAAGTLALVPAASAASFRVTMNFVQIPRNARGFPGQPARDRAREGREDRPDVVAHISAASAAGQIRALTELSRAPRPTPSTRRM